MCEHSWFWWGCGEAKFAFEFFPHTGKEKWILRDIVDDIGSSNLFLAKVGCFNYAFLRVCFMRVYLSALFFYFLFFGNATVGKLASPILDASGKKKKSTMFLCLLGGCHDACCPVRLYSSGHRRVFCLLFVYLIWLI